MNEKAYKQKIKAALDDCLSGINDLPSQRDMILRKARNEKKEERKMKKIPLSILLAAILVLGTTVGGLALADYYSVRDYLANGAPSESFEAGIVEVNQTKTNDLISMTVGDAIFDGRTLAFTLELNMPENASSVYLSSLEIIIAQAGKPEEKRIGLGWSGDGIYDGFLYPSLNVFEREPNMNRMGISQSFWGIDPEKPVQWKVTFRVLRPIWKIENDTQPSFELEKLLPWKEAIQTAYERQTLRAENGKYLERFLAAMQPPEGVMRIDWAQMPYTDRLVACGAMQEEEPLTFEFTTQPVHAVSLLKEPLQFSFDECTAELQSMIQTSRYISCDLVIRTKDSAYHSRYRYVTAYDQNGEWIPSYEDSWFDSYYTDQEGEYRLHKVLDCSKNLESITFHIGENTETYSWKKDAGKEWPAFTVQLPKQ